MIELKNVSLTTSKTNYIDPRITIAFLNTRAAFTILMSGMKRFCSLNLKQSAAGQP